MATYNAELRKVFFTVIERNPDMTIGYTVPIPTTWTVAQIERYLKELESWS